MKKTWKSAEKDFEESFKSFGKRAYVFRLTDTATAKAIAGKGAFIPAQPSDFLVVCEGDSFFAEVKSSVSKTSFPFSNISTGQINAARRVIAAGGSYVFFIRATVLNKWFRLPAQIIIANSAKSAKWPEWADYEWNPNGLS
jgi:penicillin-binding protein-related factor A (putative recombinase)